MLCAADSRRARGRSIRPAIRVERHRDGAGQCTGIRRVLGLTATDPHDAVVDDEGVEPDQDHDPDGDVKEDGAALRSP